MLKQAAFPDVLQTATVRNFDGGWNVIDNDLNLSTKFSKTMKNVYRGLDGALTVRWGTRLFATLPTDPGRIVGMTYFNSFLICATSHGKVYKVNGAGAATLIWSTWSVLTTYASFAQFNGELVCCNGIDKPLLIKQNMTINFLVDIPSGSNANTPIGKFVAATTRFVLISGDFNNPDRLYVSNQDTSGTWRGDAIPNNAVNLNLGAWLGDDDFTVHGIKPFRGSVIAGFAKSALSGVLGKFDGSGNHVPDFSDAIPNSGGCSHSTMQAVGDIMMLLDLAGVGELSRTVFNSVLKPDRLSTLIDPELQKAINGLSFATLEDRTFAIYNANESQYMLFVPNNDVVGSTTETVGFVFGYNPTLGIKAWSQIKGWNFTSGCRSSTGRVFFGDPTGKIYIYGCNTDPIFADFVGDTAVIADGSGVAIDFDWELPWSDNQTRMKVKKSKFIQFDTVGAAQFTCHMYVDNFRTDRLTGFDTPLLVGDFLGSDAPGFGAGSQPYGGGRRTGEERLWRWPAKYKIFKLRILGSTKLQLKIVSISLATQRGSVRR